MARLSLPLLPTRLRWAIVVAIAAGIFYFSVLTAPPEQAFVPRFELIPLDKWRHFLGYAVFASSLWYASTDWSRPTWAVLVFVIGVSVGYGAGMEIVQSTIPNRLFSVFDAYANALGVLLVTPLFYLERFVRWRPFPGSSE